MSFNPIDLETEDVNWAVRRLQKPIKEYLESAGKSLFIGGGFVRSSITGQQTMDLDLFTDSEDHAWDHALEIARDIAHISEDEIYRTEFALTLRSHLHLRWPIQIIHRWTYPGPEECINDFDFTIACAAIWCENQQWRGMCHPLYYADLAARRLRYLAPDREEEPGGSLLRVLKFTRRGFRIDMPNFATVLARFDNRLASEFNWNDWDEQMYVRQARRLLQAVDPMGFTDFTGMMDV